MATKTKAGGDGLALPPGRNAPPFDSDAYSRADLARIADDLVARPSRDLALLRRVLDRGNALIDDWSPTEIETFDSEETNAEAVAEYWTWAYDTLESVFGRTDLDVGLRRLGLSKSFDWDNEGAREEKIALFLDWLARQIEANS
jgi:hypothetical protein